MCLCVCVHSSITRTWRGWRAYAHFPGSILERRSLYSPHSVPRISPRIPEFCAFLRERPK